MLRPSINFSNWKSNKVATANFGIRKYVSVITASSVMLVMSSSKKDQGLAPYKEVEHPQV